MKSKFFGLGAKLALSFAVVMGTLTSCYEKEEIKTTIDTTPKTVTYTLSGSVYNYTSLDNIDGANVTLAKKDGKSQSVTTENGGHFSIRLDGLTDNDRGTYTLTVSAAGYKTRQTSVEIWFEKADNQVIATQMDFALKSNEIQGEPVEIVAGKDDQNLEISGVDENGNQVKDEIFIPAGLLGDGVTQTITIQRNGLAEEKAASAVRIFEGKPSGLQFDKNHPIEIFFKDADPNKGYKVYYDENGIWKLGTIEGVEGAEKLQYSTERGGYVAKIYHFSRFKFAQNDYNVEIAKVDTIADSPVLDSSVIEANDRTEGAVKVFTKTWNNAYALNGFKYAVSLDEVFNGCPAPAKEAAVKLIEEYLTNSVRKPAEITTEFPKADVTYDVTVEEYFEVSSYTLSYGTQTIQFNITIDGTPYTVSLENVNAHNVTYQGTVYTHGHGHGHGHGNDNNAGGGIIDAE